jgi:hypothetical protein
MAIAGGVFGTNGEVFYRCLMINKKIIEYFYIVFS